MSRFEKNLSKLAKTDPKIATLLPFLAREEVSFSENSSLTYVFGLPDESFFEEARAHLKGKKALVFLEDDLHLLKTFLETKLASKVLSHPKMHLIPFRDLNEEIPIALEELMWHFVQKRFDFLLSPYYEKTRRDEFLTFCDTLSFRTQRLKQILDEYFILGAPFFYNFYKNIRKLKDSYLGDHLFGKFKKIPAVIVGAGPSLEKQIPLLKSLKNKALIFAGGSSMNALNGFDLMPHFGAGIDPNLMQKKRLLEHQGCHLPYFYRNRMNHQAFDLLSGEKLYISGSGGYEIGNYFDEALNIKETELDEGHNVVNFLTEIAERMGCSPIVYVGLDLALTGGKEYSSFVEDVTGPPLEKKIVRTDIYGQPVQTYWKWVAESFWISTFAKEHPKLKCYNATEGGIGIEGVENISLQKVVSSWKENKELDKKIKEEIAKAKCPPNTGEIIEEALQKLLSSFERSENLLKELIEESERVKTGGTTGKQALLETELADEIAYIYVLSTFNLVATKFFSFEWRHTRSITKKQKLGKKKLKILLAVAQFNKALIQGKDGLPKSLEKRTK